MGSEQNIAEGLILGATGSGPLPQAIGPEAKSTRAQVFEAVRALGDVARADLCRTLGISPGTMTAISSDLIARGLLCEVEGRPKGTARGRPPVALTVVPDAGFVIGVKLAEEVNSAVLVDYSGRTCAEVTVETTPRRRTTTQIVEDIEDLARRLLDCAGRQLSDISAIGIGMSGIVDHRSGIVPWSPRLAEVDVALRQRVEMRLERPVFLDNDANMLALAELWFGSGRMLRDFAVITIEEGVGMGLVHGQTLYRGSRGMGLELGHTKVERDGALCRCGQRGCLEAYVSDYALAREAATALDWPDRTAGSDDRLLEDLAVRSAAGDRTARSVVRRAEHYLSIGLSNIVQLFDPDLIVLSGLNFDRGLLDVAAVIDEMGRLTLSEGRSPVRVEIHGWNDVIWARGAAALALSGVTASALAG